MSTTTACARCHGHYGPTYMDGEVCVFCAAKVERERLVGDARRAIEAAGAEPSPRIVIPLLVLAVAKLVEAEERALR